MRRAPKLQTVFSVVTVLLVFLPLMGILFLKPYQIENQKQIVRNLGSRASFIANRYRQELQRIDRQNPGQGDIPGSGDPIDFKIQAREQANIESLLLLIERQTVQIDQSRRARASSLQYSKQRYADQMGRAIQPLLFIGDTQSFHSIWVFDQKNNLLASRQGAESLPVQVLHQVEGASQDEPSVQLSRLEEDSQKAFPWNLLSDSLLISISLPIYYQGKVAGVIHLSGSSPSPFILFETNPYFIPGIQIFMLLLVVLFSNLFAKWVLKPLHAIRRQAMGVLQGKQMQVLDNPGIAEFAELSAAIQGMAVKLTDRNQYLMEMTRSLSHELKTPVTSLVGVLELIEDHGEAMNASISKKFHKNMQEDCRRIEALLQKILELARADLQNESSPSSTVLIEKIEQSLRRYKAQGFHFEFEKPSSKIELKITPWALETILNNLLENAVTHGDGILLKLSVEKKNEGCWIRVENSGPTLSEQNLKKVLEPFFTTRRALGGTGLGLSIVNSLVRKVGGELDIGSGNNQTWVEIKLPLAGF